MRIDNSALQFIKLKSSVKSRVVAFLNVLQFATSKKIRDLNNDL